MSIGYVTIGALDVPAALPFYDAVLGAIGYHRAFLDGGWAGYGPKDGEANTFICPPFDGEPARPGNGIMVAFLAPSKAAVAAAHAAAIAHGGADEGAPGPRPADSTSFYGAYVRDPTGNKLCIFMKP
ncbi:VOC family protein [Phenylobacterium sp.]|uniref:VOC family protein n=1 Tax=Phenylobacterium sp. TaxID=1871053 RepID=UPI002737BA88|nr:VOC family protein [Phenylobacterium sp.]MDP3869956.1 VOC family protein [Phenylobacterium sp.]